MSKKIPVLYHLSGSPPSRVVVMTARALNLPIEIKEVDFLKGELWSPEFLKMNPMHAVPTLDDNGFYISDSHAISTYLINQYGPKDFEWYPSCPKKRALIDQKLHFDSSVLYFRMRSLTEPILWSESKGEPATMSVPGIGKVIESYDFLETFLQNSDYLVGDSVTLADISCGTIVTSMELVVPLPKESYPKTYAWLDRLKARPDFKEINQPGIDLYRQIIVSKFK